MPQCHLKKYGNLWTQGTTIGQSGAAPPSLLVPIDSWHSLALLISACCLPKPDSYMKFDSESDHW